MPDDKNIQQGSFEAVVLQITEGPGKGEEFHLLQGKNVIGRANEARVRIDQTEISRQHTVINVDREIEIEDMGSAIGTILNGRILMAKDFLFDNDEIRLGPCTLRIQIKRRENRKHIMIAFCCLAVALIVFLLSMIYPRDTIANSITMQQEAKESATRESNWRNWETMVIPGRADLDEDRVQVSVASAMEEYDLGTRLYLDRLGNLGNAYQALLHYKRTLGILNLLPNVEERPAVAKRSIDRIKTLKQMMMEENEKRVFSFQRAYKLKWWSQCDKVLLEIMQISPWTGCRYRNWAAKQKRGLVQRLGR
ncbi:MAG: FHA domain-containing protein [Planctomycetes bacterium]|nr:FHA domain-containing protein [Planctomycetota bacterium]